MFLARICPPAGDACVVAFGCDTGAIAVVYPDDVCAEAEQTAATHTLATAKGNIVTSMNVLDVFMRFLSSERR